MMAVTALNPKSLKAPAGPYTHGLKVSAASEWLFTTGQVALAVDGAIPEGAAAQSELVWSHLRALLEDAGMTVERVYKVKEGRPNVVDLIKGERMQLVINTPHGLEPWFDEQAIRRAAVNARIPTITTLAAARAAAEGIAALQRGEVNVFALQKLHAERPARVRR